MKKARDIMTANPQCVTPEDSISRAAEIMRDADVGVVPVVEDQGTMRLAGMLTDRDIVVRAVAERSDPATTTIGSIVTREVVMIEQHASAADAAVLMRERGIRRVLVCDSDRKLVGIVSLGDLAMRLDPDSALSDISEKAPTS